MNTETVLQKMRIEALNPMQEAVIDAVINSQDDLVVLSPTGTGKTLAFLLSLLPSINVLSEDVQMLVVVPGRELALQSANVLKNMGTGVRAMSLYGGRPTMDEHRTLRQKKPHVVFATPGRMNDHLDKGNIVGRTIRYVVIDEFDKCLNMGFRDEMHELLGKLQNKERILLLSATDADEISAFFDVRKVSRLNFLDEDKQISGRVQMYQVNSIEKDKLNTLEALLKTLGEESSIVFLNYRDSVERTDTFLKSRGFTTSTFHGGLEQHLRESELYKFANASTNILVSTDLASRGLDIPAIDNIIHYHLPLDSESYVHRVGRTARWKAKGRSFFILSPEEAIPQFVENEPQPFILPVELPTPALPKMVTLYVGKGKRDKLSKGDIVGFLCKKGGLTSEDIGQIDIKDRYSYVAISRKKQHIVMKNVAGEKIKGIKTIVELIR